MSGRLCIRGILLGFLVAVVCMGIALGDSKNGGGAILVHTDDAVNWTESNCDQFDTVVPQDYAQFNTRTDKAEDTPVLIWFIAAFHETANPGVNAVYFGHDHNLPDGYHINYGPCGPIGTFEVPDNGWPDNPTTAGNTTAFGDPVVGDHLFPFYYFDVRGFEGAYYCTGINPVGGQASFTDDSNPPLDDPIDRFGCVRWYEEGFNDPPVPPTLGACCFEDASCEVLLEHVCRDLGGIYGGDDVSCYPNPCGSCCYWYRYPNTVYERRCAVTTEPSCDYVGTAGDDQGYNFHVIEVGGEPIGSEWSHAGTTCAANAGEAPDKWWCFDPRSEDPIAACCDADGRCTDLQWSECREIQDAYFWGYGTDCDPNPCPVNAPGACCHVDGSCELVWVWECTADFVGGGIPCDPVPCPFVLGACCFNTLCFQVGYEECVANGGIYIGYLEPCDPNPCPPTPGACCHANGTCSAERWSDCELLFMGWGVPCDPDPCPPMPGACCHFDGSCTFVLETECPGEFLDEGASCDPNPCFGVPSACCYPDGSCELTLQDDCTGAFQGWGTVCDPNPCPQPTGACCFMRLCFELTEDDCVNNWGYYMGDGTPCEPNPCISDVTADEAASRLFLIVSPNPAADVVTIGYGLPVAGLARLDLFDASGRRVREIHEAAENAGGHVVSWDGSDDAGRQLPSGIYFVRLVSEGGVVTRPVMLAR